MSYENRDQRQGSQSFYQKQQNQQEFVDGFRVFAPNQNAPEWIVANISIEAKEFYKWLVAKGKTLGDEKYIKLDVRRSRKTGGLYATVNNFKPKQMSGNNYPRQEMIEQPAEDNFEDDIPF